jgi:hypothetical protein
MKGGENIMLHDRSAQAIPEWIVGLVIVILLGGVVVWGIATAANGEGANAGAWINSINVPNVHP